jgi:hypothetical protein
MLPEGEVAMFHLDYLSCLLTILATVLVGRKSWTGLLISIVNSMIICVIGFRTSQFGFIPANLICICVHAFSIRSWVKKTHTHGIRSAMGVGTTETTMVNAPYTPIVHRDVGDEALQGTCVLFGSLTVATTAQSKSRHHPGVYV